MIFKEYIIKIIVTDRETGNKAEETINDVWNKDMDTPDKVLKIIMQSYRGIE